MEAEPKQLTKESPLNQEMEGYLNTHLIPWIKNLTLQQADYVITQMRVALKKDEATPAETTKEVSIVIEQWKRICLKPTISTTEIRNKGFSFFMTKDVDVTAGSVTVKLKASEIQGVPWIAKVITPETAAVFPNPILGYNANSLRVLYPDLTEEEYKSKPNIKPTMGIVDGLGNIILENPNRN
jgi:hypothetical protein